MRFYTNIRVSVVFFLLSLCKLHSHGRDSHSLLFSPCFENFGGISCFTFHRFHEARWWKLHSMMKKDCYPIRLIDKLLQRVSRSRLYAKLDMQPKFHQICVYAESRTLQLSVDDTPSTWYKVLPFGLTWKRAGYVPT